MTPISNAPGLGAWPASISLGSGVHAVVAGVYPVVTEVRRLSRAISGCTSSASRDHASDGGDASPAVGAGAPARCSDEQAHASRLAAIRQTTGRILTADYPT